MGHIDFQVRTRAAGPRAAIESDRRTRHSASADRHLKSDTPIRDADDASPAGTKRALEALRHWGVRLGPYLLIELLLPGGTLVALLLFLHQRKLMKLPRMSLRLLAFCRGKLAFHGIGG